MCSPEKVSLCLDDVFKAWDQHGEASEKKGKAASLFRIASYSR